jgi:single-stranded-DNA-specific exonuclease
MTPVFMAADIKDNGSGRCVGADKSHLRLVVEQGVNKTITGIGFGLGDKESIACEGNYFKMAYSVDENEWNGRVSLQLKIKDIKP